MEKNYYIAFVDCERYLRVSDPDKQTKSFKSRYLNECLDFFKSFKGSDYIYGNIYHYKKMDDGMDIPSSVFKCRINEKRLSKCEWGK